MLRLNERNGGVRKNLWRGEGERELGERWKAKKELRERWRVIYNKWRGGG